MLELNLMFQQQRLSAHRVKEVQSRHPLATPKRLPKSRQDCVEVHSSVGGLLADRYQLVRTIQAFACFPWPENNPGICEPSGNARGECCVFKLVALPGERESAR